MLNNIIAILMVAQVYSTTLAIIGTNDIHGSAFPTLFSRQDTGEKYNYGGLPIMGTLINIIKSQNPSRVMYLDAGDQFQGGIESSKLISSGKIMNDFFGLMEINGSAIGNHQFDFGPDFLFPFMSAKDAPNLAANIRSQTGKADFMPKQSSSQIFSFPDNIKIGVIGLATVHTPQTTAGFSKKLFPQYQFLDYKDIVIAEAEKLRKNGADAVILVSHVGNSCVNKFDYGIWSKDTPQPECAGDGEISMLIKSLPPNTIQGVVQGHAHTVSHVYINDIPVIGNVNGGYYFNVMYLKFQDKKVIDSYIQGPIPVCEKIFANTGKCNYIPKQQISQAGPLKNWTFHNQPVFPQPRINTIYQEQWLPMMEPFLVELVQNQIFLTRQYKQQCELANLINNLVHANFTQADFSVLNIGGLRTNWIPGIIQEQHFYDMLPFDNVYLSFNISGQELLDSLKILQEGSSGLYQFWGIQTTVQKIDNKFTFISARMQNGEEIDVNKYYTGVASDFLLNGGDDFKNVIGKVYTPRDVKQLGEMRDSIRQCLKDLKVIQKGTLIDPNNPRIIIQE